MTETYPVERGIPIPPKNAVRNGSQQPIVAALRQCEIGDSVLVPHRICASGLQTCLREQYAMKFTRRTFDEGVRLWRIA